MFLVLDFKRDSAFYCWVLGLAFALLGWIGVAASTPWFSLPAFALALLLTAGAKFESEAL